MIRLKNPISHWMVQFLLMSSIITIDADAIDDGDIDFRFISYQGKNGFSFVFFAFVFNFLWFCVAENDWEFSNNNNNKYFISVDKHSWAACVINCNHIHRLKWPLSSSLISSLQWQRKQKRIVASMTSVELNKILKKKS